MEIPIINCSITSSFILANLEEQYPLNTTYHLDFRIMNLLKGHIKSLESGIQFSRKEIKERNTLISSLIPLKMPESKYCESNNLQNSNSRGSCLQEQGEESATCGNASGKNLKEVFVEKTKTTDNIKTASLSHSAKPGNSNSNIRNRVNEMRDSSINDSAYEGKKNIILGDSIIKHVNSFDTTGKLNKCKVLVKRLSGARVRRLKDRMKSSLRENPDHFVLHIGTNDRNSDRSPELIAKAITDVDSSLKN